MKSFKRVFVALLLVCSCAAFLNAATIATFADPSPSGSMPMFTIDLQNDLIKAGWEDTLTNLDLGYNGGTYENAFFTMSDLAYTGDVTGGITGGGVIKFYTDNADPQADDPVLQINFSQATLTLKGIGGTNVFALSGDNVAFSGSLVGTVAGSAANLVDETFSFSFANQTAIGGNFMLNGYTSTASFTSSAVVPEPVSLSMLGLGALALLKRRN